MYEIELEKAKMMGQAYVYVEAETEQEALLLANEGAWDTATFFWTDERSIDVDDPADLDFSILDAKVKELGE